MAGRYNDFLGTGFYSDYNESQRRDNLFFVFKHGATEQISYSSQRLKSLSEALEKSLLAAIDTSEQTEKGLIKELCKALQKDSQLHESILEYVEADSDYEELQQIIAQGGASNDEQVKKFFNSRYFNTAGMAMNNSGDKILNSRGEQDMTDAFWRKLYQDAWGLKKAASKRKTWRGARNAMKKKWDSYAYGQKGNTWSTVGGYFGSLGDLFKETGLEDEFLDSFLNEISASQQTVKQVQALIAEGNKAKFQTQKSKGNLEIAQHGQMQEILVDIFNKFFLPRLYGPVGVNVTLSRTGSDRIEYSKMDLSSGTLTRGTTINTGQTDIRMDFDFIDDSNTSTGYRVNVSAKMSQGFARLTDSSQRRTNKYLTHIYGGGTLGSALNRIYSSPVFKQNGILSDDNFIDLAYLLINAAQGGLAGNNQEEARQAYKAVIAFVGVEDIGNTLGIKSNENGDNVEIDGVNSGRNIVNLFLINGRYIPASAYFKELYKFVVENRTEAMNTNIKFATTFTEADSSDPQVYSPAYLNFISSNGIANMFNGDWLGRSLSYWKGDPQKMREYILKNTKAQEFNLKWTTFWRNLYGT